MKVSIDKIYEKALSMSLIQKSKAFVKRTVKMPDIPRYINMAADKAQTIMNQPLAHDECPIPEESDTERSSSRIFRSIFGRPNKAPALNPGSGNAPSSANEGTRKKVSAYKMGEYKITENDSDELLWEMHFGMGALKEGKCFRKGQILFLGPSRDERPGFLTGEFLDRLKPLPCWLKTRYYFSGSHVRRCDSWEKVSENEMRLWADDLKRHNARKEDHQEHAPIFKTDGPDGNNIDASYALKNYEIVITGNGTVLWKKSGTHNRVNSGRCLIMEDILFIGPLEIELTNILKKQFHERLKLLPKWDHTEYYTCYTAILGCNPER
jgi:hypothetical protein